MRYKISHALVQFGGDVILRDVNFEVHDKEKIAIVGRNGCGKTTLLRLIAGDISMNNLDSDEECGITMAGKQEIGFLRQVNFTEKDVTVEEEIKKVFEPVFACEKRMRELPRTNSFCTNMTTYKAVWRQCGDIRGSRIWRLCFSGSGLR